MTLIGGGVLFENAGVGSLLKISDNFCECHRKIQSARTWTTFGGAGGML
jgi:hypothetical protein